MLGVIDWSAIGAVAGCAGVLAVIGGATVTAAKGRAAKKVASDKRFDLLIIRLFGLPADPDTGAGKIDGEFDRVYHRMDDLPAQIIDRLKGQK